MALIKDRKEKPTSSGAYDRIFNIKKISKINYMYVVWWKN